MHVSEHQPCCVLPRDDGEMIVMHAAAETADPSRSELDVCYVRANQFPSNILAAAIERTTKNGVKNKLFWFYRAVNYIHTQRRK